MNYQEMIGTLLAIILQLDLHVKGTLKYFE
jgi:hypothetical protein